MNHPNVVHRVYCIFDNVSYIPLRCIVLRVRPYSDSDPLARPSVKTAYMMTAYESTQNVGVVLLDVSIDVVILIKAEVQIIFFQQA